ncbi:MAG TPA: hypothetical protein VM285_16685 [Polyangia bacterium]|nr:hypothetical protein [Polyangia bacterium]
MGRNRSTVAALGLAAALAAACWGEVVPVWPDGPVDSDTGTGDAPGPIPGGGLGGGPLDGRLDLFLIHEETAEPVAGVRVLLVAGSMTRTAVTDADGHAVFVDDDLAGPVELHALAEGFVAETFLAVDAALATLFLRPVALAPAPQSATLAGTVSGWEALPEPAATQRRAVLVAFGPRWSELADHGEPLIGLPVPRVVVEIDGADPAFELEVQPVRGALHCYGGLVETFGTADTGDDAYDWRSFGAIPGLSLQPGEALSGLQADLDGGLPVTFHAGLNAFPSTYTRAGIELVYDLGDQGTVWVPGTRQGGKWVFVAPDQTGPLSISVPFVIARGDQTTTVEEGATDIEAAPLGRFVARNLGSLLQYTLDSPFLVPGMPSPPGQVGFDGQRFQCLPMAGTDLAQIEISDAATGTGYWRVTAFCDLPGTVELPPFQADWGFAGVPEVELLVRAWTAAFTADQDGVSFASYPQLVREVAFEAAAVLPAR